MHRFLIPALLVLVLASAGIAAREELYLGPIDVRPPHLSTDPSVRLDYDIVYVRAPRKGDTERSTFAEIVHPAVMDAGADLMLLHPDGTEEVLVPGGEGSVMDPCVSFDGEWVYYSQIHTLKGAGPYQPPRDGAHIYKIHVRSRKIVQLTHGEYTPNTGAAEWSRDFRTPEPGKTSLPYGALNTGPCPLPAGRVMFTSSRNAFKPPKHPSPCLQLFVMDEDGSNVEQVGYLNLGMALHPTILKDGRVLFSSLESQGLRNSILWGLWSIRPDGTGWGPVISAFDTGSAPNAFHFQTQLSDGSLVAEEYYNQNNSGFGAFFKLPPAPKEGYLAFGPAFTGDPRNPPLRFGRFYNGKPKEYRLPFSPSGIESLTPFANNGEGLADPSLLGRDDSPRVGKLTHPSGAPDNHLLCVWTPGPANHQNRLELPEVDAGIYLIKSGLPVDAPGKMLLVKNDPRYNEQWPRALVPYRRIYGVDEPARLLELANDGKVSPHLPEGTPFGLVGTSSLYKRESYPLGAVPPGALTARFAGGSDPTGGYEGLDPFNTSENGASLNWFNQGAEAGRYANDDIHAVRILVMEPTTDRSRGPREGRLFRSHASERLRILGEIPVRKFGGGGQPLDPDGNPDTSFLAKLPADTAFTFQTLDKDGMVLNMAQTWHQLRPGEVRNDCGGCHAHSQSPTSFALTAAAKPGYAVFDLTKSTPLLTTREGDESGRKWDAKGETGLRFEPGVKNVEYFRDIRPIFQRSCAACHTGRSPDPPAALVLDDDSPLKGVPGTYYRLAEDHGDGGARFGYKPVIHNGTWRQTNASRCIRMFQSRRSLLAWKLFGCRTDGWTNDDFPSETVPGDPNTLRLKGQPVLNTQRNRDRADLDFTGSRMPPPEAVASGKVKSLSPEDRLTMVRWIDLGCPIDLDYDPARPEARGFGWMADDNRPTLTLTSPRREKNPPLSRLLVGMCDYYSGLDEGSFRVVADFPVDGIPAGENLAPRFRPKSPGVRELKLAKPISALARGRLEVSVKDRQGNVARIDRTFSVAR